MITELYHPDDPLGPCGRLLRLRRNLPWMLAKHPGNIVEIGAGYGETTRVLLEAAAVRNRKVLVLDPFSFHDGWEQHAPGKAGYAYPIEKFLENVGNHPNLVFCRKGSQSREAKKAVKEHLPVALLVADGLMSFDGMMADLLLGEKFAAAVIDADDFEYRPSVKAAVLKFHQRETYHLFHDGRGHEAYLFRA